MTITPFTPASTDTTAKPAADAQPTSYDRPTTGFWELFGNPEMSANLPSQIPAPAPDPQYPDRPLLGFEALFWNTDFAKATPAAPNAAPVAPAVNPVLPATDKPTDLVSQLHESRISVDALHMNAKNDLFDKHFHMTRRSKA